LDKSISSEGLRLSAHVAVPAGAAPAPGLVLCHGFPRGPRGAASSAGTFPELADRIARDAGWVCLAFNFRGTGSSQGDFSGAGWIADASSAVTALVDRPDVRDVWIAGVGEGGTIAICAAAADDRIRGVATLAAPASLRDWGRDPARLLDFVRRVGMVRTPGFPPSVAAWAQSLAGVDAAAAAAKLAPRPLLVLHGTDDALVPLDDARVLVEAAGKHAELRLVQAGGHELRHDPRAVAALLSWLDRQVM
jgi:putative redox protein